VKEVLKRFDQLEKKVEVEVGGLRADIASRLAELEMRVTTALLDTVPFRPGPRISSRRWTPRS
jgi:hypothetical protein